MKTTEAKGRPLVKLNANENFFISRTLLSSLVREVAETLDVRLYPGSESRMLIDGLSDYLGVPPELITIGNGSDPLIELIVRLFLRGGREAIAIAPTFSMYRIAAELEGGIYKPIPLREDFSLDAEAMLAEASPNSILCFLCSPNNPTATQFEAKTVQKIIDGFRGVVVVDEAYADFADYSFIHEVEASKNLIVLRTFSKTFGLAGVRLGYVISNPEITAALRNLQVPFAVSSLTALLGLKVLEQIDVVKESVRRVREERTRLIGGLNSIEGVKGFDSAANFVLFKTRMDSEAVFEGLLERGIIVRRIGEVLNVGRCLRVTVGLPEMNRAFLDALRQVMGGK